MTISQDSRRARGGEGAFVYANPPPLSWRVRLVAAGLVVALLLALTATYMWQRNKLSVLGDYRNGYAVGTLWRLNDEQGMPCDQAGTLLYGANTLRSPTQEPGYSAFVSGCQDGLRSIPEANWWNLRSRIVSEPTN